MDGTHDACGFRRQEEQKRESRLLSTITNWQVGNGVKQVLQWDGGEGGDGCKLCGLKLRESRKKKGEGQTILNR